MQNTLKAMWKNRFWIIFPAVVIAVVCLMRVFPVQVITTYSMNPTMPPGMVLIDVPTAHIEKGDIISFRDDKGSVVTHRVYAVQKDGIVLTKGDANNFVDNPVVPLRMNHVIGKVLFNQGISWVMLVTIAVIIAGLIVMGYLIFRILTKKDDEVEEEQKEELVLSN